MDAISIPTLRSTLILIASLLVWTANALAAAFPGAQGYDADAAGFNFIGNYCKAGPDDDNLIAILIDDSDLTSGPYYYLEDLYYNGVAADPWDLVGIYPATISPAPSQAAGRSHARLDTDNCPAGY